MRAARTYSFTRVRSKLPAFRGLNEGDMVSFELEDDRKGREASRAAEENLSATLVKARWLGELHLRLTKEG